MKDFALSTDIETIMELLEITAKELADSIGVTPTTISRWRKNEEQVSTSKLNTFCILIIESDIASTKELYLALVLDDESKLLEIDITKTYLLLSSSSKVLILV